MKLMCRMGIHLKNNRKDISEELKNYYTTGINFVSCSCGKEDTVEHVDGIFEPRNHSHEDLYLEEVASFKAKEAELQAAKSVKVEPEKPVKRKRKRANT